MEKIRSRIIYLFKKSFYSYPKDRLFRLLFLSSGDDDVEFIKLLLKNDVKYEGGEDVVLKVIKKKVLSVR